MVKKINKFMLVVMLLFVGLFTLGCNINNLVATNNGPTVVINGQSTLNVGDTFQATAVVRPTEKYEQNVVWSLSEENIVSITETGVVTALSSGRVTIKATFENEDYKVTGRFSVKVLKSSETYTDEVPSGINIITDTTVYSGTLKLMRIETIPVNASHDVVWSSTNDELATVDSFGVVTFKQAGIVTISAKAIDDEDIYDSVVITIVDSTRDSDIEKATIECIENTKNSVLGVANYIYNNNNVLEKQGIGSGFVYDVWGYFQDGRATYDLDSEGIVKYGYFIITNRHVVEDSDALKVYLHTIDEEIDAELVQYDNKVDLAVVTFDYDEYIAPLEIADSDTLKAGQFVIAIGNPEGFTFSSSATQGIISHPLRYISSDTDGDNINDWDAAYIQHDAAINPGNSGGPLLNLYGQVIGINTLKYAATDIDNMGFSIPSSDILDLLPYLEKGQSPVRATIGVTIIAVKDLLMTDYQNNPDYDYIIPEGCKSGLYVTNVTEGSVAFEKILKDDIILSFNSIELKNSLQLRAELGAIVVGSNTEIEVVVLRNGEEVKVTLVW